MKQSAATKPTDRGHAASRPQSELPQGSNPDEASALLRDELACRLRAKLAAYGWRPCSGDHTAEAACFMHLIPAPDATFTLVNPATGEHCVAAFHFEESENAVWYACTLRLPGGKTAQEHGLLDVASGVIRVVNVHGEMGCSGEVTGLPGSF